MKCTTKNFVNKDYVSWTQRRLNLNTRIIYDGIVIRDELKNEFSLITSSLYDLNINEANANSAGYYECYASASSGLSVSFVGFFNVLGKKEKLRVSRTYI